MKRILIIEVSPRGPTSASRKVSQKLSTRLRAEFPEARLVHLPGSCSSGNPLASPDRASWNRAVAPDRKTVGAQERFAVFFRFGSHVRFLIELCSGGRRL
jgi:FMN-dependent NADH-azoreductase